MVRAKTMQAADIEPDGATDTTAQADAGQLKLPPPRMGEQIAVVAGAGRVVINREFGGLYSETEASSATVNLRILRLLDDADLIRQPPH